MDQIVAALTDGLTTTALFGVVASLAGLVVVAVLVSLGLNRTNRTVGGMSRGKAKI